MDMAASKGRLCRGNQLRRAHQPGTQRKINIFMRLKSFSNHTSPEQQGPLCIFLLISRQTPHANSSTAHREVTQGPAEMSSLWEGDFP